METSGNTSIFDGDTEPSLYCVHQAATCRGLCEGEGGGGKDKLGGVKGVWSTEQRGGGVTRV